MGPLNEALGYGVEVGLNGCGKWSYQVLPGRKGPRLVEVMPREYLKESLDDSEMGGEGIE
jgi:hypothetical protein